MSAVISFIGAFVLVSYRVKEARTEDDQEAQKAGINPGSQISNSGNEPKHSGSNLEQGKFA